MTAAGREASALRSDQILRGGGQSGARLRAIDWATHPLGPPESWSPALRGTLRLLLAARSGAALFWGPARTYLYNDAMIETLGDRHPWAQGADGAEVWAEIWDVIGPQLAAVEASGEGQSFDHQHLRIGRAAAARDTWWTYSQIPIEDDTAPTGMGGVLVLSAELTTEHEANERILHERRRLMALFDTSSTFVATLRGEDHVFEMTNPAYDALVGRSNLIGKTVREALPEVVSQGLIEVLDAVFESGEPFIARNRPVVLARGGAEAEVRWLDFVYQRHDDPEGHAVGIIAEGFDVTDHVRALQRAREANAIISTLLEHSPDLIVATGADGDCQLVSASSQDILGYAPEEMVGRRYTEFVASDVVEVAALFDKMIAGAPMRHYENRVRRKDGTAATIRWSAAWSVERQLMIAVGRDVSDRVAAEERLLHAERLDAIGKLTGGIAHDFNNLLTIILGNLDIVHEALGHRPELQEMADLARTAAERGAELTNQLLSYARQQRQEPVVIAAAELIAGMEPLIRRAVGETVSVELQDGDAKAVCLADRAQLETALLNLAINARDAMPDGGSLSLASGVVIGPVLWDGRTLEGAHVWISVRDAGAGMTPATLARAREPFFTTKAVGRGTGLGLSMVSGFAEQSGGALELRSEEGRGTEAIIYLPLSQVRPHRHPPAQPPRQTALPPAKVLLVEDNAPLREQVSFMLKEAGCVVAAVGAAAEALQILDGDRSFDLLFTDLVLPGGISGRQLADAARLRDPGLKVLMTSGFSADAIAAETSLTAPLLRKPYRRHELLQAVEQALSRQRRT